jgi:6-pyruvoyltetrahydropterin/6-carboxytetrahydropterin synthase
MLTCKKTYFDVPFAHRQHLHDGHCSFVHGHNWDISITFACDKTDENGFVVDFGKLKFLKKSGTLNILFSVLRDLVKTNPI